MNETRITVHGNVVTEPDPSGRGRNGSIFTTFRIAYDAVPPLRPTASFVDGDTSFYSVIAFNAWAANVVGVAAQGPPRRRRGLPSRSKQYVGSDGQPRTSPEIDAAHVGHDLSWGRATFERVSRAAVDLAGNPAALSLLPVAALTFRKGLLDPRVAGETIACGDAGPHC